MHGEPRALDPLGRVTIPIWIRKELSLHEGDEVFVAIEGKSIRLTKKTRGCHKCGCTNEFKLKTLGEITLCTDCIKEFGE